MDIIADLLALEQLRPHIDKMFPLEQTKEALKHFLQDKTIDAVLSLMMTANLTLSNACFSSNFL